MMSFCCKVVQFTAGFFTTHDALIMSKPLQHYLRRLEVIDMQRDIFTKSKVLRPQARNISNSHKPNEPSDIHRSLTIDSFYIYFLGSSSIYVIVSTQHRSPQMRHLIKCKCNGPMKLKFISSKQNNLYAVASFCLCYIFRTFRKQLTALSTRLVTSYAEKGRCVKDTVRF